MFTQHINTKIIAFLSVFLLVISTLNANASVVNDEDMIYRTLYHSKMMEDITQSNNKQAKKAHSKAQFYYQKAIGISAEENIKARQIMLQHALSTMVYANSLLLKEKTSNPKIVAHIQHHNQEIQFKQIEKAVLSLISAHQRIQQEKNISTQDHIVEQVNELVNYANDYLDNQNYKEAQTVLQQSYKLITASVSALRAGETLVFELNFSTPKNEYDYYLAKVSDALSAFSVLTENQPNARKKMLLTKTQKSITKLIASAQPFADKGEYVSAIELMEVAYSKMQSGLYVALR